MPKLSIITVCYNDKEGLERTLDSIRNQTTRDFQYIVIDGGSTDGSQKLLKNNCSYIDYCVSESDSGIFNAMNKGILRANGEYCLFLNAGDSLYADDTIEKVLPLLGETDFISGDTLCTFDDGHTTIWRAVNNATTQLLMMYSLSHQATFIKTKLLKTRPYREDLKIVSDWEQMLVELIINNRTYKRIDYMICRFAQGGVSNALPHKRDAERKKVLDEHFSKKMQRDIIHSNLLIHIASLADEGTHYYKLLEFAARVTRRMFK